jgi:hypothetical protein
MPAPTLTSISPNVGSTVGGSEVTLTGTNFTGTTGVTIGGVACTNVVVVSSTSITCVTPAGSAGDASVVVTNGSGSNSANSLWIYLPTEPMDIYVHLKGGRGDGYVPGWTGVWVDVERTEKTQERRDAFQSVVSTPGLSVVMPGVVSAVTDTTTLTPTLLNSYNPPAVTAKSFAVTLTKDDIADHVDPRQSDRTVTWREYVGQGGLRFPYRLELIIGIGTKKRGL